MVLTAIDDNEATSYINAVHIPVSKNDFLITEFFIAFLQHDVFKGGYINVATILPIALFHSLITFSSLY